MIQLDPTPSSRGPSSRTVLVTGAASGLGAAVVTAARSAGWNAVGIDVAPCPTIDHVVADVADEPEVRAAVDALARRAGGLRAVVTAAGIDRCGALADVSASDWNTVIAVNLMGTAATIRAALPHLLDAGGTVVTVASTLGLRGVPDATAYCASKFGVVGFTRALAAELRGSVGVTLLVPGGMDNFAGRDEKYRPGPDASLGSAANVAAAVMHALSQPAGCEIRELVVAPSLEGSWP